MEFINSLVTVIASLLLYFMLKNAIPSYFTKKGSNLADKEDIREITEKVEAVKKEFSDKTEQLRSELQYSNQISLSIKAEERNAIINCYEKYHVFINLITDASGTSMSPEGVAKAAQQENDIKSSYNDFILAESKMIFFTGKEWYQMYFKDLKLKSLLLSNEAQKMLIECTHAVSHHLLEMDGAEYARRSQLITETGAKVRQLTQDYRKSMIEQYKVIVQLENAWRDECLKRVTKLYN